MENRKNKYSKELQDMFEKQVEFENAIKKREFEKGVYIGKIYLLIELFEDFYDANINDDLLFKLKGVDEEMLNFFKDAMKIRSYNHK